MRPFAVAPSLAVTLTLAGTALAQEGARPSLPAPTEKVAVAPPDDPPAAKATPPAQPTRAAPQDSPAPDEYRPPKVVDYLGGRIPRDATLEPRPRWGIVGTGIAMTATAYAASLTYAASTCGARMECRSGSEWLYMPVLGPFFTAGKAPTSGGMALATFDGFVQVAGLALVATGFLVPRHVVVQYGKPRVDVAPITFAGGGSGIGLTLTHL